MAEDNSHQDLMRYDLMAQEALRGVVREALKRAASPKGLPGEHHFYISFQTRAAGVAIPQELVERYPDEMTIVLQHQYRELTPGETVFSVVLSFGGQPKKLSIPYAAVTRFHDPSVPFALQFEPQPIAALPPPTQPVPLKPKAPEGEGQPPAPDGPKIVSLDQFRKK
jgi:hypothetical protein